MLKVIKKKGRLVKAYRLGDKNEVLDLLIREGKLRDCGGGMFEVFSREARNGSGELARTGDYIKLDTGGVPYPNAADFFLAGHRHIEGDLYEQTPVPLDAWTANEPMCGEIRFLVERKGLRIDAAHPERYFSAPLWGTELTAAEDAVIIFYSIMRDRDGKILDADFNFVARDEFERTYDIIRG